MKELIAYCGLDCERCDARIATVTDDNALREKTAKLWSKLNGIEILADAINCLGCRAENIKTDYCKNLCEIRQCALFKAVGTCGDCVQCYTCNKVDAILSNNIEARNNLKNGDT